MSRAKGLPEAKRMRHDSPFVEEITAKRSASIGRMIDIQRIEPNPHQPRKEFGDLTEMIAEARGEAPGSAAPAAVEARPVDRQLEARLRARIDKALAEARRRWGSSEPVELFIERPNPFVGMPATSSSFALAHAVGALRGGQAKSALVASTGTTASVAMILTSSEVTHED